MAIGLEGKVAGDSAGFLQHLQEYPSQVGEVIEKYALKNPAFREFYKKFGKKNPAFMRSFIESVRNSSKYVAERSPVWRRAISQYSLGSLREGLGKYAGSAKNIVYGLPGRLYSYANSFKNYGGALYKVITNPAGFATGLAGNVAKTVGKTLLKGAWNFAKVPLMYGAGTYVLYKAIKYLLRKRRERKEKGRMEERYVSRAEMEEFMNRVRPRQVMEQQEAW